MASKTFPVPKSLLGRIPRRRNLSAAINISAAVLGMTSLLLMVQISGVASMAYEVQRLEDSRTYWQESNYSAEAEIARLQSLNRIEDVATNQLKMVPAKDPIPVLVAGPVQNPAPPQAAPREATPAASKPASTRPWYQDFLDLAAQLWEHR